MGDVTYLGYLSGSIENNDLYKSKIGGLSLWHDECLKKDLILCKKCKKEKLFLTQLYGGDTVNHKWNHVFMCEDCNIYTVYRSQVKIKEDLNYQTLLEDIEIEKLESDFAEIKLTETNATPFGSTTNGCFGSGFGSGFNNDINEDNEDDDWGLENNDDDDIWGNSKWTLSEKKESLNELIEIKEEEDILKGTFLESSNSKILPSYEIQLAIEPSYNYYYNKELDHANKLYEAYKNRMEESESECTTKGHGGSKDGEWGEEDSVDLFEEFQERIERSPEQILRCGGEPLFMNKMKVDVPNCHLCSAKREFQGQILSTLISKLERKCRKKKIDISLDFGSLHLYTCSESCDLHGNPVEEVCIFEGSQ